MRRWRLCSVRCACGIQGWGDFWILLCLGVLLRFALMFLLLLRRGESTCRVEASNFLFAKKKVTKEIAGERGRAGRSVGTSFRCATSRPRLDVVLGFNEVDARDLGHRRAKSFTPCWLEEWRCGFSLFTQAELATARGPAQQWLAPLSSRVGESEERSKSGSGLALFQRSEFSQTPLLRVPQRAPRSGDSDTRVAFSLITFFWRSKRK